jgi:hypothetical protein
MLTATLSSASGVSPDLSGAMEAMAAKGLDSQTESERIAIAGGAKSDAKVTIVEVCNADQRGLGWDRDARCELGMT